ncbi:MFS transporter [Bacillus mycoides]|uniref:MDR family MFS transporter n=1 Tax=Bacillus mycoides TaxID=1405 RepID=UPI001C02DC3F|nr:MFS transporter [Bacillus mycoides]MED1045108.1 MFS transporter [Bacillus mycoides]QWH04156.1 MFS transporter [Bacillus mycoides]
MDYFHPLVWQLLGGTTFARTASFMTIPFLAIYLQNDLHASPIMIGLAVGISQLTATFGGFFGGFFTDRFGRKKIIIISMFCWSIVFYGFAFANSVWIFVLCNALNGICRAFFEPASQALMIDYTDEDKRRRLFSIRYTVINLSAVIGLLLGVVISKASSMSFPFLITATVYLLYAIFLVITLRRIEEQNTVNVTQGIGDLMRVLLQDSTLMLLIIASVICNFVYMQIDSTMPQLLNLTMADGVALYSVLIVINAATIVILQLPLGILSEKVAIKTSIIFGGGLLALGMLIFHFADNWTLFIVGMVVFSLGEIFVFPMMSAIIEMIAPAHQKATYLGVMQFQNLGGFLGPVLGGWLIIHFAPQLYLLMVGLCLVVIICYIAALRGKSFITIP